MTSSSSAANRLCKKGYRRCINGRCIGHQFWCDGTDDCGDHSDELPCNSETVTLMCSVSGWWSHVCMSCDRTNVLSLQ